MTFTAEQREALAAPLLRSHVSERTQAGRKLSYIEGWHAEAEANRIFGYDRWDSETVYERCVAENARKIGQQGADGWSVSYVCKVRVTVTTPAGDRVVREGVGAGHGIDRDLGLAHESALKEAATDAEKRALKTFGNPFGLALYDKSQANVANSLPAGVTTGTALLKSQLEASVAAGRKSSSQAKKDGDDVKIKAEINGLDEAGIRDWRENFDVYTANYPTGWLDPIHNMLDLREEELKGEAAVAEASGELDEAFRASVGAAGDTGLRAGRGSQMADA